MAERSKQRLYRQGVLYFSGLMLVAGALRLIGLTRDGFWYDELQTVTFSSLSPPDLVQSVLNFDPHPPLYYLQLHYWMAPSMEDLWVKLNSVFLGLLALAVLYLAVKKVFGNSNALVAASLFAIHPAAIFYSQETRMYAWCMLLAVGLWFFNHRTLEGDGGARYPVLLFLTALAFLYSQGAAFIILPGVYAHGLLSLAKTRNKKVLASWGLVQGSILILFIPWLRRAVGLTGFTAFQKPTFHDLTGVFQVLLLGIGRSQDWQPAVLGNICLIAFLFMAAELLLRRRGVDAKIFFLSYVVAPMAAVLAVTYLYRPLWYFRAFLFMVPFMAISATHVLQKERTLNKVEGARVLSRKAVPAVYGLILLAFSVFQIATFQQHTDFQEASLYLKTNAGQNDIVFAPNSRVLWGLSWYYFGPGSINPLKKQYLIDQRKNILLHSIPDGKAFRGRNGNIWIAHRANRKPFIPPVPGQQFVVTQRSDFLGLILLRGELRSPQGPFQ